MEQSNFKRLSAFCIPVTGKVNSKPTPRLPFANLGRSTRLNRAACLILIVGATLVVSVAIGEETPSKTPTDTSLSAILRTPTMGGKQFWSDQLIHPPWRIQRHVLTDVCRLLDGSDRAVTWGNYRKCLEEFEQVKHQQQVPPLQRRVVVVLHGAIRSRSGGSC